MIHRHLLTLLVALALWSSIERVEAMNAATFFRSSEQLAFATAAAEGRTDELESLVSNGAQVNAQGVDGMTALYWAMAHQSKKGVSWLLDHGADPNVVNARDGTAAISLAAMAPDPWYLKEILAHGGNPNFRNPLNQHTPLMDAIVPVSPENARALIAAGADLNPADARGFTVLFNASSNQRYEMVYDMLKAGADPTIKMGKRGNTILWSLRHSRAPPGTTQYDWLMKVRDLLRQRGIDVDNGD
jgi:ankyrin repeat protein